MILCVVVYIGEMLMALDESEQAIDLLRKGQAIYKTLNAGLVLSHCSLLSPCYISP